MGFEDKIQETVGKAKEGVGDALGNEELRAEGQEDRIKGSVGEFIDEAKERVGDAVSGVADKVEELKDKFTGQ